MIAGFRALPALHHISKDAYAVLAHGDACQLFGIYVWAAEQL